ncbi:APC family permease [Cyclobacterium jeungdonense]|uniref:Amino acid permease n=1 Tax=Cyclobacterium jeungdonense TaxID=708087 RepID=A0ABT8C5A9_9BACT|nr:amino acid permease [Cyclobacterium jeungdonense]MDN3687252.1 amino acid permease [Cyclobacterium jeungdonense]
MSNSKAKNTGTLKKTLNLPLLIFYGVGTILGLGIYVLLGKVGGEAGMLAPFAFLFAAVLAGFTGLSYGELSSRIPKSAGEVNYIDEAFGKKHLSMAMGWLIVLSAIVSTATVVNGYVGYVHVFVDIPDWLVIVSITLLLGAVGAKGISESAILITVITIIEISGLFLVIFIAGDNLASFSARWNEFIPGANSADWEKILLGAFLAFFTFIGFQDMVNVAEETKNPEKHMPIAIMVSLVILTVLYILVAVIAGLGLSPEELNQSEAPLADILAKEGENYPKIISAIGLIAIVNGVLVQIVMSARVMYGMAEKKMAPEIFGKVNSKTSTPIWSTVFATLFILILALSFDLKNLAIATNYILILVFILINLALIAIKRKVPHPEGIKTFPMAIPVLGAIFSFGILIFQAWSSISSA